MLGMSEGVRPRGQQDIAEAACQPRQGRSATRGLLGEQHISLGRSGLCLDGHGSPGLGEQDLLSLGVRERVGRA